MIRLSWIKCIINIEVNLLVIYISLYISVMFLTLQYCQKLYGIMKAVRSVETSAISNPVIWTKIDIKPESCTSILWKSGRSHRWETVRLSVRTVAPHGHVANLISMKAKWFLLYHQGTLLWQWACALRGYLMLVRPRQFVRC